MMPMVAAAKAMRTIEKTCAEKGQKGPKLLFGLTIAPARGKRPIISMLFRSNDRAKDSAANFICSLCAHKRARTTHAHTGR